MTQKVSWVSFEKSPFTSW